MSDLEIRARPLTPEAFAPFGQVLSPPREPGRLFFDEALASARPLARPGLSLSHRLPTSLPVRVTTLERHRFSSQTFVPLDVSRWLIVVAPHAAEGGPDPARALAFVVGPGQGVTYGMDTWHHGSTVLDRPARFAVFMWRDGTSDDEEFVDVAPFVVRVED